MKPIKTLVVMPAYNAAKTLAKTVAEIDRKIVSSVILVDDGSRDNTVTLAKKLGLTVFTHPRNLGYGGNQKTCYWEALKLNPDVVVMIHPDYQYDATQIEELIRPIVKKRYDFMFGSRIRSRSEALAGGMPRLKYFLNRAYTLAANILLGVNFSEYMSGMRAYSRRALKHVPFQRFSNDFIFDQQFTLAALAHHLRIGEVPIPIRYYSESSSIGGWSGVKFYCQSLVCLLLYWLYERRLVKVRWLD